MKALRLENAGTSQPDITSSAFGEFTTDLLALARLDEGRSPLRPVEVDLGDSRCARPDDCVDLESRCDR